MTCHAVSVVSELNRGLSMLVISPQPLTPSATSSTSTILRSWVTPKLVSKGVLRRMRSSRSVMLSIFIRLQKVSSEFGGHFECCNRECVVEELFQFEAKLPLNLACCFRLTRAHLTNLPGQANLANFRGELWWMAPQDLLNARVANPPLGDQAICGQCGVQPARCAAVNVRQILARNGAQVRDVEVCVSQLQRVEGPFNEIKAAIQSILALREL